MPYDIVDNIPLPPRERKRKYNLDELEVGQALVIPEGEKYTPSAIYSAARSLGVSVSIRKIGSDDPHGRWKAGDIGIFRVADKDAE